MTSCGHCSFDNEAKKTFPTFLQALQDKCDEWKAKQQEAAEQLQALKQQLEVQAGDTTRVQEDTSKVRENFEKAKLIIGKLKVEKQQVNRKLEEATVIFSCCR